MYGTVARIHVKPGMQEAFMGWAKENAGQARLIPGHVETLVYQMDANPDVLFVVMLFESHEAYRDYVVSADQAGEFEQMKAFLAVEPEWHDGDALLYLDDKHWGLRDRRGQADEQPTMTGGAGSQSGGQLRYGTVARFRIKPGMRSLFLGVMNYSSGTSRTTPGPINLVAIQTDKRAAVFLISVVFESREAYRANSESPEQHEDHLRMMEFLADPPDWNDGAIIWHS